jgi:AraC-like DNA-binding protein
MSKIFACYNTLIDDFSFHHSITTLGNGKKAGSSSSSHRQFEILYLAQGSIKYLIEGEEYLVQKGDVIFVPPHEVHSLETVGDGDYERIVVMFDLEKVYEILSLGGFTLDKEIFSNFRGYRVIPRNLLKDTRIQDIMFELASEKDQKVLPLFALSKILELIMELEKIFSQSGGGGFPTAVDPLVKKAIEYIAKNIESPLSLDQIASALFTSKSSLCHKFAKSMNISVNRYVTVKKIYHSAKLIKQGMGALDAAVAVGYNQYTTFYHNYKKILGVPPSGRIK